MIKVRDRMMHRLLAFYIAPDSSDLRIERSQLISSRYRPIRAKSMLHSPPEMKTGI